MDSLDPEAYLIYNEFFEEEDRKINKNESCCGIFIVLFVLTILITVA